MRRVSSGFAQWYNASNIAGSIIVLDGSDCLDLICRFGAQKMGEVEAAYYKAVDSSIASGDLDKLLLEQSDLPKSRDEGRGFRGSFRTQFLTALSLKLAEGNGLCLQRRALRYYNFMKVVSGEPQD